MSSLGGDYSFPRSVRLTRSQDFKAVFAGAEKQANRYLTVLYRPNTVEQARLGLAISKRVAKRASDRNRIKRLIRESFRQIRNDLPAVDIVVMVRPIACNTENATLLASLYSLWQRIIQSCEPC
ncbi:ribonuclease P protein component [Spiribacter sp. C176]|uniref:Ribonuclease P protein component n=1 Tax=Spiribacter salilacus TaxID=2664894 RepID=A0A6N7QPR2_9GAMM|nr:ribonuclease P protein component [Spiribacter salilacus]MRH78406.1 ribonuclease P protein component [Spiribacter salilacus]